MSDMSILPDVDGVTALRWPCQSLALQASPVWENTCTCLLLHALVHGFVVGPVLKQQHVGSLDFDVNAAILWRT